MNAETEFLGGLLELGHGIDVEAKLKELSSDVNWAVGWPVDKTSFWNAEAFMWRYKVGKEAQNIISDELSFLNGRNLDVGCGAYSYVLGSVGFDFSPKMLDFNDQCREKVVGDLERLLPFDSASFDSVTAVFVLNYVQNYTGLLEEVNRVLKSSGVFVMVLSAFPVNEWQRQKEVTILHEEEWKSMLEKVGFVVTVSEKEKLWFFRCKK
jgi:ubiquinone/menaquinone biosynthesis C-methylase UbiE